MDTILSQLTPPPLAVWYDAPHLGRGLIAMLLQHPMPVESLLKPQEGEPKFLYSVEGPHPEQLFFESTDETPGHPVTLGEVESANFPASNSVQEEGYRL